MLRDTVHGSPIASPRRRLLGRTLGMGLAAVLVTVPGLAAAPRSAKGTAAKVAERPAAKPGPLTYEVSAGDTLSAIAARFHVRVADLCKENGLDPKQVLRAGRTLRLPSSAHTGAAAVPSASERSAPKKPSPEKPAPRKDDKDGASKPLSNKPTATKDDKPTATKGDKPAATKDDKPKDDKPTATKDELGKLPSSKDEPRLAKTADELAPLGAATVDKRALSRAKSGPSWLAYSARPKKRGYLELHSTVGRWSGQAVVDGWTIPEPARAGIAHVLASWRSGAEERIHGRLIRLLARISDQFGGRPIRIVSGYRPHAEARFTPHSKHTLGRAVDFSIPGVPNEALRDYLRQSFTDVGIGYYPNSTHVHLDIREETTYWVDYSGPGQKPSYGGPPRQSAVATHATRAPRALSKALDVAVSSSLTALAPQSSPSQPRAGAASAADDARSIPSPAPPSGSVPTDAPEEARAEKAPAGPAALNIATPDTHSPEDP